MRRPAAPGEPWRIDVTTDGSFLPLPHRSLAGLRRILDDGGRLGAVLLEPRDVPRIGPLLRPALRGPRPSKVVEIYGWALAYQFAGPHGIGLIDPHDDLPGMPACYESPAELADRQEFLAARGIASRAIAVVTQPSDFDHRDGVRANRYCPLARLDRACGPAVPPP